jgi:hypothetical protein
VSGQLNSSVTHLHTLNQYADELNKTKINLGKRDSVDLTLNELRIWFKEQLYNHELHSNYTVPGI